jgi:WD40 repeat protein
MINRLILIILILFPGLLVAEAPLLMIDSGGHMSKVKDVMFTSDNRYLVSAAYDKTVRVWDVETGDIVRTIRGQSQIGPEGKIYAAALSPDDRWLAVGGWMKNDEIRLIDFRTGEVVFLFKGHSNVATGLAFSPDSRLLLSVGSDATARIWDVNARKNLHVLKGHKDDIYGLAFSPDGRVVATASDDKTIKLWNSRSGRLIKTLNGHTDNVLSVDFTPDGKYLLSGSDDMTIRLWKAGNGQFVKVLGKQTCTIDDLSISPDSRFVLTGCGSGSGYNNTIFAIPSGQQQLVFKKHGNIVLATAISADGSLAATGGGSNKEVYIWNTSTGAVKHKMVGKGGTIWSVGFSRDGRSIAWGKAWKTENLLSYAPLQKSFNLSEDGSYSFSMGGKVTNQNRFSQGIGQVGSLSIRTKRNKVNTKMEILRNDGVVHTITRTSTSGYRHKSMTLSPDGRHVVSGGGNGALTTYDPNTGKQQNKFIGHSGDVWGVAVSPDSRFLLSGSGDQTVKLWDLQSGKNLLTIFHASDNQWVAWTPEGYYASSSGGDQYIGWQLNQGQDKSALYYPASRFADQFRLPEVVGNYLRSRGNLDKAIRMANEDGSSRNKRVQKVAASDLLQFLPPTVFFHTPANPNVISSNQTFCVKALARSMNEEDVTDIWLTMNGRKTRGLGVEASSGGKVNKQLSGRKAGLEQCIQLTDRENTISVIAANRFGQSDPESIRVTWKQKKKQNQDIFKPALYVLSIGISEYEDSSLNLDVAHKDAIAVTQIFEQQQGKLFREVKTRTLLNDQATRDGILDGLDWILQESTQKDMSIIFIAGHGMNDKRNNYYFLPHDADANRLRRSGVKWFDFQDVVVSLPSKTILMVDTCHSGNVTGKRRGANDMTEAIRELNTSDSGVVVMTAATGREVSQERAEWGHGAFTKALVEGLGAFQADYNSNGIVEIKELDLYITERVKTLTGGSQHPTTEIPKTLPNFPVVSK